MSSASSDRLMPTWFIPHGGGPCFFMDWNPPDAWDKMADFLKNLHTSLPRQPQAILMVSAHWLEPHVGVTSENSSTCTPMPTPGFNARVALYTP